MGTGQAKGKNRSFGPVYSGRLSRDGVFGAIGMAKHLKFSRKKTCYRKSEDEEKTPFRCDICKKTFSTRGNLVQHSVTHIGGRSDAEICVACGKGFAQKRYLERHQKSCNTRSGEKQPLYCGTCGKEFPRQSHLERHELTHAVTKSFKCIFCGVAFTQKTHLQRHLSSKHREKASKSGRTASLVERMTLFACLKCPENVTRSFPSRWELRRHHRRVHATELSCRTCEEEKGRSVTFETFSVWKSHVDYHQGRRPYLCDICWRGFAQKLDLDNHTASAHQRIGKFQCSVCDAVFAQRTQVDRHVIRHHSVEKKRVLCRSCLDTFPTEKNLIAHLRIRHRYSERIHFCKYCDEWFVEKAAASGHTSSLHFKKLSIGLPLTEQACSESDPSEEEEEDEDEEHLNLCELKLLVKIVDGAKSVKRLKLSDKLPPQLKQKYPQLKRLDIEVPHSLTPGEELCVNVPVYTNLDCDAMLENSIELEYP